MKSGIRPGWPGLFLALVLAFWQSGVVFAGAPAGGEHWVGTWMASPQGSTPGNLRKTSSHAFNHQTVRMIVRTTIGGESLRVRFSNLFGTKPLVIGAAHVALRSKGARIVPGSDRALTFSGRRSITVPVGAPVLSDPVNLRVPPLGDLAVSVYVPESTGPATWHPDGLQNTYISKPGNFTASADMPYARKTGAWYWLTGVEVQAAAGTEAIVALGDSITDGYNASNADRSWPSQLAARLEVRKKGPRLAVLNAGISGNRVLHDVVGPNVLARFDRDVLARSGVKFVILLEGINDIGFPHLPGRAAEPSVSAAEIIAGLRQIVERAHAHGIRVFGATLTPFEGAIYYSKEGEAKREAVNRWIRTGGAFDGVIDFDRVVRDPKHPLRFLPADDSGDHLHPGDAGYKAMAEAIRLALFR
jgi:lysophospholipase L1-like esterase